jgi:hypothetical protein
MVDPASVCKLELACGSGVGRGMPDAGLFAKAGTAPRPCLVGVPLMVPVTEAILVVEMETARRNRDKEIVEALQRLTVMCQ